MAIIIVLVKCVLGIFIDQIKRLEKYKQERKQNRVDKGKQNGEYINYRKNEKSGK